MRFFKGILPNITIALSLSVLVVLYVHGRNPFMGFLTLPPFKYLCAALCVCSLLSSIVLYGSWRRTGKKKKSRPEPTEEE